MVKTEDERKEDRKKRINNAKSKDHLIKEDTSKGVLDGKVVDVYDIINGSSDPVIIRLRKLKDFGITDDIIAETYSDIAGNVENESNAITTLDVVFRKLAITINQQPNGIVINLNTGDLNRAASFRQAARLGILDNDYYEYTKTKFPKDLFKSFKLDKDTAIRENKLVNEISIASKTCQSNKEFLDYLTRDTNKLNITDTGKKILDEVRKELSKEDPLLMRLYRMETMLDNTRNTPEYEVYLKRREKFLENNPQYRKQAENLRDENGFLKGDVVLRYNKFNENVKINCLMTDIAMANDKIKNGLSAEERKNLVVSALAGLHYSKVKYYKGDLKQVQKECWNALELLNPDLKDKKNDFKGRFYNFLEKELGLEEKLDASKLNNLMAICNEGIDKGIDYEKFIEALKLNDKEFDKYYRENSQELDIQAEIENTGKSNVEKYFYTSKIKFSKEDEKNFNDIYKNCTVESWIDNKQDALILDYATLVRTKDKLQNSEKNDYNDEKINQIDIKLKEFSEKYPHIKEMCEDENGNLKDEVNGRAENYQSKMIEGALLKFYSIDILSKNNGITYQNLDDSHKKAYLRNVLVGLNYGEESNNKSILKLAQRRLELLNTEDKTFISFDKTGNPIINQKAILEEYRSMSNHKWNSFEELVASSERRKDVYIIKKLDEYEKLQENDFIKLENPEDRDSALSQIESIRAKSNQFKNTKVQENESQRDSYIVEVDNKSNKVLDRLKNLFNPRITDGTEETTKKGFLSRIFDKIISKTAGQNTTENNNNFAKMESPIDNYKINNEMSTIEALAMSNNAREANQQVKDSSEERI